MKRTIYQLLFFIFISVISVSSCGDANQKITTHYRYLAYLPHSYQVDAQKNWPLIIFLHGASLRGDNPDKIKKYGIPKLIEQGHDFDFIIISPQCPAYKDWSSDNWFPQTFDERKKKFRISGLDVSWCKRQRLFCPGIG